MKKLKKAFKAKTKGGSDDKKNCLMYRNFLDQRVTTDWISLESYKDKTEKDLFEVEYVSEIAQQHIAASWIVDYLLLCFQSF
ncbi:hypothetical protein P3S68_007617 [Capsicum galapagoense]